MDNQFDRLRDAAKEAYEAGKYRKAWKGYSKALKKAVDRDHHQMMALVLTSRSAVGLAMRHYEAARVDAQRAVELAADWSKPHFRLAEALLGLDRYPEAILSYQRSFQLESDLASLDLIESRLIEAALRAEAKTEGIYFRSFIPGHDICLQGSSLRSFLNPIRRIISEVACQMKNIIYAIGDVQTKECLIVDLCWDVEGVLDLLKRDGMHVRGCIVTHNHFDHVGGYPPPPYDGWGVNVPGVQSFLKRKSKKNEHEHIKVYIHEADAESFQRETGIDPELIVPTQDGQTLWVGRFTVTFHHTPGHTPGAQCIQFTQRRLLTGDTLFAGGSRGRTDLPGGSEPCMRRSLADVLGVRFDNATAVYPGHRYFNREMTTIGMERRHGALSVEEPDDNQGEDEGE